jgi:hypothetical protein
LSNRISAYEITGKVPCKHTPGSGVKGHNIKRISLSGKFGPVDGNFTVKHERFSL